MRNNQFDWNGHGFIACGEIPFWKKRLVSGHEFTRAKRTSVRVNSFGTIHFLSAEGLRAAPGVGAKRYKTNGFGFFGKLFGILFILLALGLSCGAQVLSISRIQDPQARLLQQQYISQLRQLGASAATIHFPYSFYFSEKLDIDEAQQKQLPLGSIRFDNFHGQIVLAITGNYYASYSAAMLGPNLRARKTFQDVVLPLLKVAVANVDRTAPVDAYAFEIAHHVRSKVLNVNTEGPENLMVLVPRGVAELLVEAKDAEAQQGALLESEIFLNGEPFTLWLTDDTAPADVNDHYLARHKAGPAPVTLQAGEPGTLVNPRLLPEAELTVTMRERAKIPPDLSPTRMEKLQTAYEAVIRRISTDLSAQAHFVPYAPPAFIAFRDGAYLQLSMNTDLEQATAASQYRIAALAFDSHISHLLRAVSKYFPERPQFEGVDFSTTVHQGQGTPLSVEFVVPFLALSCYEKYDCTGQELINRSVVLINGERVSLDLQRAESDFRADVDRRK